MNENIKKRIADEESGYENALMTASEAVIRSDDIKIILITGGSCAGKTTTTKKLAGYISAGGRKCHTVSIDDFYKNPADIPLAADGTRDFESISSIDLEYLHECISRLVTGREAHLPVFDFIRKRRDDDYRAVTLGPRDVVIIEGLHALNPVIYDRFADKKNIYGIYLYTHSTRVSEPRLLRRLVRDFYYRDSSAENTFSMWESVKNGEKLNIEPYSEQADMKINTYFHYEKSCFVDDARRILSALPPESRYRSMADALLEQLDGVEQIDIALVPEDSLLREFLKY